MRCRRRAIRMRATGLSRVEADQLARDPRKDVNDSQAEDAPAGYEEMTGAYFRSLSEQTASPATPPPAGK